MGLGVASGIGAGVGLAVSGKPTEKELLDQWIQNNERLNQTTTSKPKKKKERVKKLGNFKSKTKGKKIPQAAKVKYNIQNKQKSFLYLSLLKRLKSLKILKS